MYSIGAIHNEYPMDICCVSLVYTPDKEVILDKDEFQCRLQAISEELDAFKLRPWSLVKLSRIKAELLQLENESKAIVGLERTRIELDLLKVKTHIGDINFRAFNYCVLLLYIALIGVAAIALT